jgi:hypothetical protein
VRGANYSNASIDAQVILPKNVAFLPPHSQVSKTMTKINSRSFQYIADSLFAKTKLPSGYGGEAVKVKMAKFEKTNSPLVFKSYLTLYTLNGNTPKFTAYQNDFYVSKVIRSSFGPENFEGFGDGRGDYFYISGSN